CYDPHHCRVEKSNSGRNPRSHVQISYGNPQYRNAGSELNACKQPERFPIAKELKRSNGHDPHGRTYVWRVIVDAERPQQLLTALVENLLIVHLRDRHVRHYEKLRKVPSGSAVVDGDRKPYRAEANEQRDIEPDFITRFGYRTCHPN